MRRAPSQSSFDVVPLVDVPGFASVDFLVEPASPPPERESDPEAPSLEDVELGEASPPVAAAFVLVLLDDERSFLAQPEPLKWTAGETKALRSVSSAPHAGQNRGAGASIPWMNSVRVEQFEQT
jgi:hypothetical protein